MKKSLSIISISILIGLFATGCGSEDESTTANNNANNNQAEENTTNNNNVEENNDLNEENNVNEANEEEADAEITVEHELGDTVVPANPESVVVFDYGVLDTLRELEINPVAVPQGNIPAYLDEFESDEYTNAGTLFEPDFETLYDISPDLIIISGRAAEAYDDLTEIAPTIHVGVDTTNYIESFKENTTLLGEIFGKTAEVDAKLAEIDEEIASLHETASSNDSTGLITMASEGALSAYGPGSRFGVIHDEFGVAAADEGIEEANHGQTVSFEYVLETNPDYLFVLDRGAVVGGEDEESAQDTIENELVQQTTAYQEDNIIYLDPGYWYLSGGGLTSVSEMVKEMQAGLE